MAITGKQLAQAAINAIPLGISYDKEDCIGFVLASAKRAGQDLGKFAGSNDFFRRGCTKVLPWDMGVKEGMLQAGAVSFIVEPGWNTKYDDSLGDANHIGIITIKPEIVHSSQSRGGVFPSTYKNAWNYMGWPKIDMGQKTDQGEYDGRGGIINMIPEANRMQIISLPQNNAGETVNARKYPKSDAVVLVKIRDGTELLAGDEFYEDGKYWKAAKHEGFNIFIVADFVQEISAGSTDAPPYFPINPEPQKQPLTVDAKIAALEHAMSIVLGENWRAR